MLEQFPPLEEFIQEHWEDFASFSQDLQENTPLYLEGEGVIYLETRINNFSFNDIFYIFMISGQLYGAAIKEDRKTIKKYFGGLYALDNSLLTSQTFKEAQLQNFSTKYRNLGAKIEIECKAYNYHQEQKLLFSKSQKVDLLYSLQLLTKENDSSSLKVQVYPSLKQAVQYQKMVDQINARTQAFLESKNKK